MVTFPNLPTIGASQVTNSGATSNDADAAAINALANPRAETVDNTNAFTITNAAADYLWERNIAWRFTDDASPPTAQITLTVPATPARGLFAVLNKTGQAMQVEITGQPIAGPVVAAGDTALLSSDGTNVELLASGAGVATFLGLTDTPGSFTAGKFLKVNAGGTALIETDEPAGAGDALPFTLSPTRQGVKASLTGDLASADYTTAAAISWNQSEEDTDSFWAGGNPTRLTIPAGVTRVSLVRTIAITGLTANEDVIAHISKNGTLGTALVRHSGSAQATTTRFQPNLMDEPVVATDYFELYLQVSNDTAAIVLQLDTNLRLVVEETTDTVPSLRTVVASLPAKWRGARISNAADNTDDYSVGLTQLPFDETRIDTDSIADLANDRLTVPAGVSKVQLSLNIGIATLTSTDVRVQIYKNGTADWDGMARSLDDAGTGANNRSIITGTVNVAQGDYFEVFLFFGTDATTTITAAHLDFQMEIVEFNSSTDAVQAYIAVPPTHNGVLLARSAVHSIPDAAEETLPWQAATYDTAFDPGDGGPVQRFWLGVNTGFVDGDVSVANDEITETAHGYQTGEGPVQLTSSGTLPTGLALATDYWFIRVDANTYKFATSRVNALAGTDVDITAAAGGGTHTVNHESKLIVPANVAKVRVKGAVEMAAGTTPVNRYLTIHKNGAEVQGVLPAAIDDGDVAGWLHAETNTLEVSEGDVFELIAFQDSSAAVNVNNDVATNFALEVVEESRAITYPGVTVTPPWRGALVSLPTALLTINTYEGAGGYIIPFGAEQWDTDGFHDNVTNNTRLTIPAGLGITRVRLFASAHMSLVAANDFAEIRIFKNGVAFLGTAVLTNTEGNTDRRFSATSAAVPVVDGDYFEFRLSTETDTSVTINAGSFTSFGVEVVETDENAFPPEEVSAFVAGTPAVSDVLYKKTAIRRFTLSDEFAGSLANARVAGTGATTFDVKRNGSVIGTIVFAASGTTGTFATTAATTEVFDVGDIFTIESQGSVDASLNDIDFSFWVWRS